MRSTLASQGLPLSEEASKPMLKALLDVQKLEMQEAAAAKPTSARLVTNMSFDERAMEQQMEASKKRNQRMLDAISSYLTVEQRQALERQQEAQLKLQEAQLRMMRAQGADMSGVYFMNGGTAMAVQASQ
ncbi:MAG TPA: hypothetical protein VGE08_03475 [Steroidobacter sp.]|uniref:hypothetical protein n=1 Tax=Steroidobacter sp. TaxID=1978227 RepID=UPI002ED97DA2